MADEEADWGTGGEDDDVLDVDGMDVDVPGEPLSACLSVSCGQECHRNVAAAAPKADQFSHISSTDGGYQAACNRG